MKTEIYYFSGTGNSLTVARDIARKTAGDLIPIASRVDKDAIQLNGDIIGIVFPVYYGDLPLIIRTFAERLVDIENKYIFAIGTYGGGTGFSLKTLSRIIRSRGGKLAARYGVHMPQNAFGKPWENQARIFGRWEKKRERIHCRIALRKKGMLISDWWSYVLLMPVYLLVKPLLKKGMRKLAHDSSGQSLAELINLADRSFSVNQKCNGCGTCVKVCPVDNIEMGDRRPVWRNKCQNCLACLNWCPNRAIQGGIAQNEYYYRHPKVQPTEMMKWKEMQTGERDNLLQN